MRYGLSDMGYRIQFTLGNLSFRMKPQCSIQLLYYPELFICLRDSASITFFITTDSKEHGKKSCCKS